MNANLDKIAQDLYGKIQTRFSDIQMGDENAEVLSKKEDIPNARFFEFEYEEDGEALGTIAITLDAQDGVVIQVSGDLVDDKENTSHHGAFKFIRGFRQFAKDRLLNFDVQNIGKSNLDKRDYQFQSKRKEQPVMPQAQIMENKMYGNAKMSYQDLGENTRLVVKHTQPVNIELAAGRTMHIESIYIENAQGERFKYAQKHLNGARALAEHIKHGGTPYDAIGKHITGLSEELASLRKFKGYVSRQEQVSEAMGTVTGRVIDRIEQIKETIHKLQRAAYYETFVESFEEQDEQMIPEEIQTDLIDRLTVRTFNEELKSVFPYIYKFIDESEIDVVEVSPDDLLAENPNDRAQHIPKDYQTGEPLKQGPDGKWRNSKGEQRDGLHGGPLRPDGSAMSRGLNLGKRESVEDQYESLLNDIVREDKDEILSPNPSARKAAIDRMNELLSQNTQVGANGDNGVNSLRGLIDDPEFIELVKNAPAETDLNDLVKGWVETNHEELLDQLVFPEGEEPAAEPAPVEPAPVEPAPVEPAPVEPAAEEPAPVEEPAPMAEDKDSDPPFDGPYTKSGSEKKDKFGNKIKEKNVAKHLAKQGMAKAIEKAKKAGATLETQLDFGSGVKTLAEIIEECGMSPQDAGYDVPSETGLPAILKYVAGFYNKMEGNFPLGGMRIKIKIKKAAEDGEFGDVSAEDLSKVLKFIDMKDPSGSVHQQEQDHVLKLAGVRQHDHSQVESQPKSGMNFDISNLESKLKEIGSTTAVTPSTNQTFSEETSLARIIDLVRR